MGFNQVLCYISHFTGVKNKMVDICCIDILNFYKSMINKLLVLCVVELSKYKNKCNV